MRSLTFPILALVAGLVYVALGQTTAGVSIVSPRNGDIIQNEVVTIRYVLAPGVSAEEVPTINLVLDNADPVQTNSSEYTFELMPGQHTVIVQLLDANGTPIMGARDQVQFTVVPPRNKP
jgi:hypothetical protein